MHMFAIWYWGFYSFMIKAAVFESWLEKLPFQGRPTCQKIKKRTQRPFIIVSWNVLYAVKRVHDDGHDYHIQASRSLIRVWELYTWVCGHRQHLANFACIPECAFLWRLTNTLNEEFYCENNSWWIEWTSIGVVPYAEGFMFGTCITSFRFSLKVNGLWNNARFCLRFFCVKCILEWISRAAMQLMSTKREVSVL